MGSQMMLETDPMWLHLPAHSSAEDLGRVHQVNATDVADFEETFGSHGTLQSQPFKQQQQYQQNIPDLGKDVKRLSQSNFSSFPPERDPLNEIKIPSLEDRERFRKLDGELAKVRSWLEHSALNANDLSPSASVEDNAGSQTPTLLLPSFDSGSYTMPHIAQRKLPESNPIHILQDSRSPALIAGPASMQNQESISVDLDQHTDSGETRTPPASVGSVLAEDFWMRHGIEDGALGALRYHFNGPWTDFPDEIDSARIKEQPPSSNAAIGVFLRKARDLETASLAATLGSRRRSEADLTSIVSSRDGANVQGPSASGASREASLFRRLLIRRNSTSTKKRKDVPNDDDSAQVSEYAAPKQKDCQGGLSPLKRVIIRPKSPRLDISGDQRSSNHRGPTLDKARRTLSRMQRSRSDLSSTGAGTPSALAEQWARQGGPPVPSLRRQDQSPGHLDPYPTQEGPINSPDDPEGDDDAFQDTSISMPLRISEAPARAEKDSYILHIRKLNPRVESYMLQRLVTEQDKRFRRLFESQTRHSEALHRRVCATGDFCNNLGKGPKYPGPASGRTADTSAPIFWVAGASPTPEGPDDGEKAHFPEGIPLPPVNRLPAEFECPLCFQVKKIVKPSDWTKHVNEDIQPFTCTFPDCSEAKSFKRKADWVRHESERHRHLEAWQCDLDGCYHKCYRRDNFVQHLVREHRLPEPTKIGKAAYRTGSDPGDIVAQHVERCREESRSQPTDEPCRFCGAQCATWKKLSVHLAQHMQQISIPILKLIGVEIPPSGPPPTQAAMSKNYLRQSHTPMDYTPPSSRTPSISVTSSGNRSKNPSVSSAEGWEPGRTSMVSVTDTGQPVPATSHRRSRSGASTPSGAGWPQSQSSMSGKERSRYPVMGPPSATQTSPSSGLGLTFGADPSLRQEAQTQGQYYSNNPLTPQTPSIGYGGTPHSQAPSYGAVWPTYPPPGMTSSGEQAERSQFEMQGILQGPSVSESPVQTSMPDFSGASGYHVMHAGGAGYQQGMPAHEQHQAHYYGMPADMQYGVASGQGQTYTDPRAAFMQQTEGEDEHQQYHSATYPPHYYHPGSG